MNEQSSGGQIVVQPYVVLFTDVLGQKEDIGRLEKLPRNDAERAQYAEALQKSAGKVIGLRKHIATFINHYLDPLPGKSTPEQGSTFESLKKNRMKLQYFADTVIAYAPLLGDREANLGQVCATVYNASVAMLFGFARGMAIRGGIDVGVALELSDRDLYGPVAAAAYHLEKCTATWPRIVVGDNAVRFLDEYVNDATRLSVAALKQRVNICKELVTTDEEGVHYVDFLGRGFLEVCPANMLETLREDVRQGFRFVEREHERLRKGPPSKAKHAELDLGRRYELLRNYFESRVRYWKITTT